MSNQVTIHNQISVKGVGVHNGKEVNCTFRPAPADHGICFRRIGHEGIEIPALAENIGQTQFSTSLVKNKVTINTVEHLLSALFGLGIDNLSIEIDDEELPIMDGSASHYIFLFQSAGLLKQSAPKKCIYLKKSIEVNDQDRWLRIEPYDGFKISLSIAYDNPVIQKTKQKIEIDFADVSYVKEISRARTFGFTADAELMRRNQLALGVNLDNCILIDGDKILNTEGLRYPDEFIKHKVLDLMGDLYLLGHRVMGSVTGHKPGHSLNCALIKKILADQEAWELRCMDERQELFA